MRLFRNSYVNLVRNNQDFRYLWFSQIVSLLGDWFNLIASAALVANLSNSGLAIGGIYSVQNLYGLLFSLIYLGGADNNYGFVFEGSIAITKNNYGVNLGCLGSIVKEKNYGVAIGVLGAGGKLNHGMAVGGIAAGTLKKGANYGVLVSPLLTLTTENNFLQLGLFNWADKGNGLQLGFLNYNPEGFLPIFPIFNF